MDVTAPQTSQTTTLSSAAETSSDAAALASDFDTFLQMLTAQARYQDPLEPIDSSEYAAQLAQFSMVEQQVLTNDTLAELVAQMNGSRFGDLASWIGLDARATAPALFDGSPITIAPKPLAAADEAVLVVSDATGAEVQRLAIPVSSDPVDWAGVQNDGTPFPAGTYSFTIESWIGDSLEDTVPAEVYGRVVEARSVDGNPVLVLDSGAVVDANAVTGVRQPT